MTEPSVVDVPEALTSSLKANGPTLSEDLGDGMTILPAEAYEAIDDYARLKFKWTKFKWTRYDWSKFKWTGVDWLKFKWTKFKWTGTDWQKFKWTGTDWTKFKWTEYDWLKCKWTILIEGQ